MIVFDPKTLDCGLGAKIAAKKCKASYIGCISMFTTVNPPQPLRKYNLQICYVSEL